MALFGVRRLGAAFFVSASCLRFLDEPSRCLGVGFGLELKHGVRWEVVSTLCSLRNGRMGTGVPWSNRMSI